MKLKKARKIAKSMGFNYVAIDEDMDIYAYTEAPVISDSSAHGRWECGSGSMCGYDFIGKYTGKKCWEDTLMEV